MLKQDYINSIRSKYSGLDDMPRETIASSVKILADDLYAKDSHFIFELVQNAEDNNYPDDEDARLRFEVGQIDLEGRKTTALIVHNNEVGFNDKNVRAICQVGKSTKKKIQGYIGEKGIGFKSVFRITTCPYIFSNGFQFRLPESDKETGLGYIVPSWVSIIPEAISTNETSIVLPLDKSVKDTDGVITALRDISPETILFLKKLTNLVVTIKLPKSTKSYNLEISKKVIFTSGNSQLVELTCIKHETDKNNIFETHNYWVTEIEFTKPPDVEHEKRVSIESRIISIAIPLDNKASKGKLFAYLPVWDETGMPFLINADFLLVSSREGIRENEDWNIWLRDCIAETYTSSLLALLTTNEIQFEKKVSAYASIPTETHYPFLKSAIEDIQEILSESECVLTLPSNELIKPIDARLCYQNFRALLAETEKLPKHFIDTVRLVCPEMETYSAGLKSIGVKIFTLQDILDCLADGEWLRCHELEWFSKLFRYLKTQKFEPPSLQKCKIIPIISDTAFDLSCDSEQPIYCSFDEDDIEALEAVPEWLSNLAPIAYLDNAFEELLDKQKDAEELKKWMQEVLKVYGFSKENYCFDVVTAFETKSNLLDLKQYISTTQWLEQNVSDKFNWDNLPIKLSNNQTVKLADARKLNLVVPESYNNNIGWPHIWANSSDRGHFLILHDAYSEMPHIWMIAVGVRFYPPLKPVVYPFYQNPLSSAEADLMAQCKRREANSRYDDTKVESFVLPSTLARLPLDANVLKNISESLFSWLKSLNIPEKGNSQWQYERNLNQIGLYASGTYENRGTYTRYAPSVVLEQLQKLAWLPSTKGYAKPSQTFLPRSGIKEIFGDTVPYFEKPLHENIRNLLGIRTEVTVAELMNLLHEHSNSDSIDQELIERIFEELDIRTERNIGDVAERFSEESLIFVPNKTHGKKWLKSSECVWEDATDILGNEYAYLQKKYTKRINFFVNRLGVKERIDTECFANRWLKLQEEPLSDLNKQRDLLERLYREIKPIALTENEEQPDWWDSFLSEAKIYSQKDNFCNTTDIILPDDAFLQRMFVDTEDIEFVWYPEDGAFSEWVSFFQIFDVPLLSMSVTEKLVDNIASEVNEKNRFVTDSAIKMIASWFKEKRKTDYYQLLSAGAFEQLISLHESSVANDPVIEFCVETEEWIYDSQQSEYPAYWDRTDNILYYKSRVSKAAVAKALAKPLMRNYKELANWIELVLGATNTDRIIEDNWNVPREIKELFRKKNPSTQNAKDLSDVEEIKVSDESEDAGIEVNDPESIETDETETDTCDAETNEGETALVSEPNKVSKTAVKAQSATSSHSTLKSRDDDSEDNDDLNEEAAGEEDEGESTLTTATTEFDYNESLRTAFTQTGLTKFNEEVMSHIENSDDGILSNPARRAEKLTDEYLTSIKCEPHGETRRKETERRLLEPPNEAVRSSLYDWYQGKCQICGDTWPKRDGNPYFAAAYIVERQNKRWLDNPGNSLCLCAKHFAQWRLASKLATTEITEQIKNLKLNNEGGDGNLSLRFQLVDYEAVINLCERHALALRELVAVAKSIKSNEEESDNSTDENTSSSELPANANSSFTAPLPTSSPQPLSNNFIKDIPSISDKRVVKAITGIPKLYNHELSAVVAKITEIIKLFLNCDDFSLLVNREGIHVTTLKMSIDYLIPDLNIQAYGFNKYPQFINHVCKSTGCAYFYFKAPADFRISKRNNPYSGYVRFDNNYVAPSSTNNRPIAQKIIQTKPKNIRVYVPPPKQKSSINRCKFCGSHAMVGSDVCYSCG